MSTIKFELVLDSIRKLLRRGAISNISKMINKMHDADVAKVISHLITVQERRTIFELINNIQSQAEVLRELISEPSVINGILGEMKPAYAVKILSELPDDDRTDTLGMLPPEKRDEILSLMASEESLEAKALLKHSEDSAGGIMTTNFLILPETFTVEEAIKTLQETKDLDMVFYIYLANEKGILSGVLSLRKLLIFPKDTPLYKIMVSDLIKVTPDTDQEEVARQVSRYNLLAIPVVNENNAMVGVITVDDVIDVIKEETTEDILKMVGAGDEIGVSSSTFYSARLRAHWLLVNMGGSIISGGILWFFGDLMKTEVIAITVFFPVLTGIAANIGIQSSTIIVRGLATGEVVFSNAKIYLMKELRVGLLLGLVCGLLTGIAGFLMDMRSLLGVSIAISMCTAMIFSALSGCMLPLFFKRMNIDPAIASGPFGSTISDIVSLFIYMSICYLLLT